MQVSDNPNVLHVVSCHDESSDFKGNRLLKTLTHLVAKENEIISRLTETLDYWRKKFPRLYFLSDYEVVELLAKEKDFTNMQPWVSPLWSSIAENTEKIAI